MLKINILGKKCRSWRMTREKKDGVNDQILKSHKKIIQKAIDVASRTNTNLIIQKDDKIIAVKPNYKYVRVPVKKTKKPTVKKKAPKK